MLKRLFEPQVRNATILEAIMALATALSLHNVLVHVGLRLFSREEPFQVDPSYLYASILALLLSAALLLLLLIVRDRRSIDVE